MARRKQPIAARNAAGAPPKITDDAVVRGTIGWDQDQQGQVPLLMVDGCEIAWEELGRMLMTYEGWKFKLEIRDSSEEL